MSLDSAAATDSKMDDHAVGFGWQMWSVCSTGTSVLRAISRILLAASSSPSHDSVYQIKHKRRISEDVIRTAMQTLTPGVFGKQPNERELAMRLGTQSVGLQNPSRPPES